MILSLQRRKIKAFPYELTNKILLSSIQVQSYSVSSQKSPLEKEMRQSRKQEKWTEQHSTERDYLSIPLPQSEQPLKHMGGLSLQFPLDFSLKRIRFSHSPVRSLTLGAGHGHGEELCWSLGYLPGPRSLAAQKLCEAGTSPSDWLGKSRKARSSQESQSDNQTRN